jgi:hypothetical protein
MSALDYAIQHFQRMAELAEALKALPAEILEHHYHYSTMGSWWTLLRCKGVRMQLVFDGRDDLYSLQCSAARKPPDAWGPDFWTRSDPGREIPVAEIVHAVREAAAAPVSPAG